jgi:hypothetical protein
MLRFTVMEGDYGSLNCLAYWPDSSGSAYCEAMGELTYTNIRAIVRLSHPDCILEFRNQNDDVICEGTNKDIFMDILAETFFTKYNLTR